MLSPSPALAAAGAAPALSPSSWHWLKDEFVYSVVLFLKVCVTPPITLQLPTHPVVFNLLSTAPVPPASPPLEQAFSSQIHFYWPEPAWNIQLPTAAPSESAPSSCENRVSFYTGPKVSCPGLARGANCPLSVSAGAGLLLWGSFPSLSLPTCFIYIYIYIIIIFWRGRDRILFCFYSSHPEPWVLIFGHMKGIFYRPSLWKGAAVKGDTTHSEGMLCMQLGASSQPGG